MAGVVVVAAAIAFFVVKRRRQRPTHQPLNTKDFETTAQHDPVSPSTGNEPNDPGHKDEHHQMQSTQSYQDTLSSPQYYYDPRSTQNYQDPHSNAPYSPLNEHQSYPSPLQQSYPISSQTASYYPPPPPLSPPPPSTSSYTISKEAQDHIRQLEQQIALGEKQLAATNQYNKSSNNPQYNPGYSEMQPMSPVRGPQGAGIPVVPEPTSAADHRELARKIEIMHAELQNLQSQLKL